MMKYNGFVMISLIYSSLLIGAASDGPSGDQALVAIQAVKIIAIVSRSRFRSLVTAPDASRGAADLYPLAPTKLSEGTMCAVQKIIPVFSDLFVPGDYQTAAKKLWGINKRVEGEWHDYLLLGCVRGYFLRRVNVDGTIESPGQQLLEPSEIQRDLILLLKDAKKGAGVSLVEESALPMPSGPSAWARLAKRIFG